MHATLMLRQAVTLCPKGIGTIFGDRRRSWTEIGERVPRMAAALRGFGVRDGAFVAVLAMNSDRYLELFFAIPWAGGALAPMNVRWSVEENAYALDDCSAIVLCVDEHYADQAQILRGRFPGLRAVIYIGEGETPEGMVAYEALIEAHAPAEDADRRGDDLYAVFYTGGTTGRPKGVAMSHDAAGKVQKNILRETYRRSTQD